MPLSAQLITNSIMGQFSAISFTGKNDYDIATGIGTSVFNYFTTPNLVTCFCSGTAGPVGQITGLSLLGVVSSSMSSLMLSKAAGKNLAGKNIKNLFDAISNGLVPNFQASLLTGQVAGCAVGSGKGRFQAINEQAFSALLYGQFIRKGIKGKNSKDLAECISAGLINHLLSSATYSIVVAGTIAPVSPAGPIAVTEIPSVSTKLS